MSQRLLPPRVVVRALIAGVCVAALAAILALAQGSADGTHWNVIGTSLAFSVASATAGAGDALRARHGVAWRAVLGVGTILLSALAFLLLVAGLWLDGGEAVWRGFGVTALLALCGSHASLVLRGRRGSDTPLIDRLVVTSIATAVFDTLVATVAIAGAIEHASDGFVRLVSVVFVVMLLSTALAPLLRRARPAVRPAELTPERLAGELSAIAQRLDTYPAVAREAQALRDLAARASKRRS